MGEILQSNRARISKSAGLLDKGRKKGHIPERNSNVKEY